jgi:hypothetical protein
MKCSSAGVSVCGNCIPAGRLVRTIATFEPSAGALGVVSTATMLVKALTR